MKILVTGIIPDEVMRLLKIEHDVKANFEDRPMDRKDIMSCIEEMDGLLCMITDTIDKELFQRARNLKMVANFGVGYDNIDINEATARNIPVSNTPHVLTDATADIAFTLIMAAGRRVVEGDRITREGQFKFWAPFHFLGTQITGKTLGIIGLGRIGKAVAKRAKGFDMKVIYNNRKRLNVSEEGRLMAEFRDFDSILLNSDFLSVHVPLTKDTHHLISKRELGLMKESAYLINTARGPVVDEKALLEALKDKEIAGAGLDVYENEPALTPGLTELDNVTLLPHVGSATLETRSRMAGLAGENLLEGLGGTCPKNCLNKEALFPDE